MRTKLLNLTVLGLVTIAGLFVTGCATTKADKPYALTGAPTYGVNGAAANSSLTAAERARATDDKGRFHAELVADVR
jgi:hypothetical protein